jgi:hypothetical protein
MIIAGAGSITARGLIEKVGGVEVLWSFWFIAFLPCSILTVLAAWWLTLWLYPPEKVALDGGYEYLRAEIAKMGPWSALEKKAGLLMRDPALADGFHPSYFASHHRYRRRPVRASSTRWYSRHRRHEAPELFALLEVTKGLEVLTNYMFAWMEPFMTNIVTTTIVMAAKYPYE